jgi:hypothetical protein
MIRNTSNTGTVQINSFLPQLTQIIHRKFNGTMPPASAGFLLGLLFVLEDGDYAKPAFSTLQAICMVLAVRTSSKISMKFPSTIGQP